jgi:uncharacterized protein YndB with AHSA1/START domain
MNDRIEKSIELAAPVSRVWRALTDSREFCVWFRAALDGPFEPGQTVRGHSTYPGHEGARFEIKIRKMEPDRLFSFTWPTYSGSSGESCDTLVEFSLEASPKGTLLEVVESGFDKLPPDRGPAAFRDHEGGWAIQLNNVASHLADAP